MMNAYKILDILMILFSTQIIRTYLDAFHDHRRSATRGKWPTWVAYILFQLWVMESGASQPLLILLINIVLLFFIYKSSYCITGKTALFHAAIFYAIWMLVEVVTYNLLYLTEIEEHPYFFLVGSAVSKIAMYISAHILKRYRKSSSFTDMPLHYWLRLFLIPIATVYIISNTYSLTIQYDMGTFFSITTILMLLVNYITFDVYDKLGKQIEMEKRNLTYEQQILLCNKQAAERETAYQKTRFIRHDLNGYLLDLKTTLQSGSIEETEEKIDSMLTQNRIYRNEVSRSGNLVIDSLINYKHSFAQKEGIDIKCYVFVPETLPYNGADLCIILGNLLDNAIEAVSTLEPSRRYVEISISQIKGNISIMVRNPYNGNIRKNSNGQILTGKPDRKNHGIGLESVRSSVDKYNGELLITHDNEIFKAIALLYPSEKLQEDS